MRIPKPWLRKQNQTWYVQIDGRQHNLGKDKREAFEKFHSMMHNGSPSGFSVRQILDTYWKWAQKNLATETYKRRKGVIQSFGKTLPKSLKAAIAQD